MSDKKIEKKRRKLQEQIELLESQVRISLGKKDSRTDEINVPDLMRKIADYRAQIVRL